MQLASPSNEDSVSLQAFLAEYLFTTLFIFLATGTITSGCHTADTGGTVMGARISRCPQALVSVPTATACYWPCLTGSDANACQGLLCNHLLSVQISSEHVTCAT